MTDHLPRSVLWVDPGVTSGWFEYDLTLNQVWACQLTFHELVITLDNVLVKATDVIVGCERFIITQNSARRPGSVEAIKAWGAVSAAATRFAIMVDDSQTSSVMTACSDTDLKALGWHFRGMPHANDAARHVFIWLARHQALSDVQRRRGVN